MMVSISAPNSLQLSTSRTPKTFVVAAVAALALLLGGCGEKAPQKQSSEATPSDLSGSLGGSAQGESQAPTGGETATGGAEHAGQGSPTAAPEATDFAPVDVSFDEGGFAKRTPKSIHVPSGFIIIVRATNSGGKTTRVSVSSPSTAQTFKVPAGAEQKITLDGLREGQLAKLIVGDQTLKIVADAEPGP